MTTQGVGLLESTEPEAAAETAAAQVGTVYVVQVLEEQQVEGTEIVEEVWRDIGTVTLPKRARRKAAVEEVLKRETHVRLRPSGEEVRKFRVLDVDSAEEIPAVEKLEPRLVIG